MKIAKKSKRKNLLNEAPKLNSADPVILELWVRAGGRCEFHGCNTCLLQDKLTTNEAKLADIGHIVARSKDGPRGNDPLPIKERNHINNLILLCPNHHRLIDRKNLEKRFPKELLQKYKEEHENRIKYLAGLGPEYETVIIRMVGNIRGHSASISNEEIRSAVLKHANRYPRYLGNENNIEIDLTGLPNRSDKLYWQPGKQKIDNVIDRLINSAIDDKKIRHLSIFALARLPFLIYLGYRLGDKVPADFYQKHRDSKEGWVWGKTGRKIIFKSTKLQSGRDNTKIALIISLSGKIVVDQLPSFINDDFTIYEIIPEGVAANRNILQLRDNLDNFRACYQILLRKIEKTHEKARYIHFFPAIPVSAAIICGRELLKNISPSLKIYDAGEKNLR